MIEHAARSASAPVAAAPVIMGMSGVVVVMGAVAKMPAMAMAAAFVIPVVVVFVGVVSMSKEVHVCFSLDAV
jgi:hypothetical protein